MIIAGKLILSLVWVFWVMALSVADGADNVTEYNPTYGTTYDRVVKRGNLICGTNDEFPGFSE